MSLVAVELTFMGLDDSPCRVFISTFVAKPLRGTENVNQPIVLMQPNLKCTYFSGRLEAQDCKARHDDEL